MIWVSLARYVVRYLRQAIADTTYTNQTQSLVPYERYFGTLHDTTYRRSFNSNVVALFNAGAVVGSLFVGPISSVIGRRPVNIFTAALFLLGTTFQWYDLSYFSYLSLLNLIYTYSIAGLHGSSPASMMLVS